MPTVSIRPLQRLSARDLKRIASGFTTNQTYIVTKEESAERTTISLTLADLDTPYHKQFEHPAGLLAYYRSAVRRGLSLGAWDGETMVGIAICDRQDWNRTLLVWEFHVAPGYQGQGIGRQMMETLALSAQAVGLRAITVETSNTNVPAIGFYRRVGFTLEAIDLMFYSNDDLARGEVAVFMKRRL